MRKSIPMIVFVVLALGIILIGCVSAPKDISREDFEGEWRQVDGTSVITFKKNKWEIVDLERGLAGYGTFKLENRMKDRGEYRIVFETGYYIDLNGKLPTTSESKDFIVKAWEEYKVPVSERINIYMYSNSNGWYFAFELYENNLEIRWPSKFGNPIEGYGYSPSASTSTFMKNTFDVKLGNFVRTE